jgi:hypothetical protein
MVRARIETAALSREVTMKTIVAAPAAARIVVKTALLAGLLTAFVPGLS